MPPEASWLTVDHHGIRLGQIDVLYLSLVGRTMLSPTAAWIVSISKTFSYWADKVAFSVWSVVSWFGGTTSPI